jgi:murein DD-endopeptidase MepM/ murein hydrolase activator NlpD
MIVRFGGEAYKVTTKFGEIDAWHSIPHSGLDLGMKCGTPLHSPVEGIAHLVDYGQHVNIGKGVLINTDDGERVILGHLSNNSVVHEGQHVDIGDIVGYSGTTGRSSGCHLHLGLRDTASGHFKDPTTLLDGNHMVAKAPEHIMKAPEHVGNAMDIFNESMGSFADMLKMHFISLMDNDWLIDTLDFIISIFGL